MEKEGYLALNAIGDYSKDADHSITVYVDGANAGAAVWEKNGPAAIPVKIFLSAGAHTIRFYHYADVGINWERDGGINNLKAVYYCDTTDGFIPKALSDAKEGQMQAVSGSFRVAGQETVQTIAEKAGSMAAVKSKTELDKYISYSSESRFGKYDYPGPSYTFDAAAGSYTVQSIPETSYLYFTITAPADKFILYSYATSFTDRTTVNTGGLETLYGNVRILRPGKSLTINVTQQGAKYQQTFTLSDIKMAIFNASDFGGAASVQAMTANVLNKTAKAPAAAGSSYFLFSVDGAKITVKQIKDLTKSVPALNTGVRLSTSESAKKISALVSNFRLYQKTSGIKQLIFSQNFNSQNVLNLTGWKTSIKGTGKAQIVSAEPSEKEEDSPMVYKKGQLVAYNIFYDDYENDPSQKQFWRYTHTPYNDGPHPDAAAILDEDGKVVGGTGKVLSESIPRFYIDGKYTVEHWQIDNTNRTGDTSGKVDYSKYDKLSNVESLTFYIEGGASAPWVTSIKTVPATVREGDKYKLQIGVDDAEKDELRLTTELYKDKKLIYTHKQTGLVADANGNYPLTTTGYAPLAEVGVYDVVCTVRDWSGAGIGTYRFTVVSEGKITGLVSHTDQWDDNRKKYNLKRFGEEVNREMQLGDYMAMATPRMRGTNVFWSGERFVLHAETEGKPSRVEVCIQAVDGRGIRKNAGFSTELRNTGKKTGAGADLWEGSLWDRTMINKWGRKNPEPLYFIFTAYYAGGVTRTDEGMVIIDSRQDYWQMHRLW